MSEQEKQTTEEVVNTDELTLEQLRELATKETPVEEETKEEVVEKEDDKPTVFRREIDLGDGSGVQVFEAETQEALIDKLVQAQTHATKKIREQSKEIKVEKTVEKAAVEPELSADEEYLLSVEFQNRPAKTQKKLLEKALGMSVEEFRSTAQRIREMELQQRAEEAANEFVQKRQDFYPCPANGARIQAYMKNFGLEPSVENLERAFDDLSKSGLLEARPNETQEEEVSAESETAEHQESSRIVKTESKPVVTQRRAGSGLSSRGRAATTVKTAPSLDELYEMPLDKLEELARKAGRG